MKLSIEDPNLEFRNGYNTLVQVYYLGSPFTGELQDDLETVSYKDGDAHGPFTNYYTHGQLESRGSYEQGILSFCEVFYENGQKEKEQRGTSIKKWSKDGVLIQDNKEYYFKNGKLRMHYGDEHDDFLIKYYTPEGQWAYTREKDILNDGKPITSVTYNDDVMHKWYGTLLVKITDDHEEKHRIHHIWMWFWEVFEKDVTAFFRIVDHLLIHQDQEIVKDTAFIIAVHKFHPYIQKENDQNELAYRFIKEFTLDQDKRNPDRKGKEVNL